MPRLPVQIVLRIFDRAEATRPSGEASPESGLVSTETVAKVAQVDISWQPTPPRISFLDDDGHKVGASITWLDEAENSFAQNLAAALEAGNEVTITLRKPDGR